ncbi:MAG: histidine kinase [Xanthomonadaceae bacterium]|nr:histidine kinase [Xanthomonadaceae bacterium]
MRLGLRMFLGVFLIVGVAAFFVMRVFVDEVKPGVRQAMESSLADTAAVLAQLAADDLGAGHMADGRFAREVEAAKRRHLGATVWSFRKDRLGYRIYVTDARGVVVYDSQGVDLGRDYSRWNNVYRTLRGGYGARSSVETPGDGTNTVMHVAAPIFDHGGKIIGVLTVANPNRTTEPFIVASQQQILRKGGVLLALAALIGLAMTVWLARGIGRLNTYARAVTAGERVPPPPRRRDEIGDLGRALETMRHKLDGKEYVEGYVQALTHEMKGPLAAIRGAAELLQEPLPESERLRFAHNVQSQSARLNQMIDKLLALAAVEQRGWLQAKEPIAVSTLLAEVAGSSSPMLRAHGIDLAMTQPSMDLVVMGDRFLLRQALHNYVDNAAAFAPAGSVIELVANAVDGQVCIAVADRGPGIPDYAVERVFERFYSLPRPRNGERSSGLGLPFVREVANLHNGRACLRGREGGGVVAELFIPNA